ncbi:hypothetical protein BYT27DRAFT_7248782 [Phlegmacium glaucopus]|nr:hypothetical protein BYT27DRAFT_7248782 [Phlegmacium glaucopus]
MVITSVGGGSHSSHFINRKLRQIRRSSTCIGRGWGVVEFGSKHQVWSIAVVTTAVAKGSLTQKIEISVEGEMSTLKGTVNESMVDQLSAFASEVTRVALEVGTQDILGGQARVKGVQGTWTDLTRNKMTSNLANQVAFVNVDVQDMLDLKMTVNSMAAQLSTLANEVTQVSLEVRRLGEHAFVPGVQECGRLVLTDHINFMATNFTHQIEVDIRGGILKLKETVSGMPESLGVFTDEVTRVAREVGTEVGWVASQDHECWWDVEGFDG